MKSKSMLLLILIITLSWVSGPSALAQDAKTGYVNLSLVFDSYEKTKEFDRDLQKEAESRRDDRDKLVSAIKKYRDELELLSPKSRADMQKRIDEKVQELQAYDRDSRLSLRKQRDTMIREILTEIDEVVQDFGRKEGYDYIFNDRILLYKRDQNDLSQEIVRILNG